MMWRIFLLIFVIITPAYAEPAYAETVRVSSGEHETFTRLVLALPSPDPWQLGRTPNGYELSVLSDDVRYDVSRVFDLIPKDRLAGIFMDPATGRLQLNVVCACHALPFSLDDQTIVIDLRDGPPPVTSSFEQGLDGMAMEPLAGSNEPAVRPRFRELMTASVPGFDWLTAAPPAPLTVTPFPMPEASPQAENIRETLVAQLADGATRAVIELALPQTQHTNTLAPYLAQDVPIRVTTEVGLRVGARETTTQMQPDGQACLPDDMLDLATWGDADTAAAQYSGVYNHIVGEFDRPDKGAVIAATKRNIYLGFGAEARNVLTAFSDAADDTAYLQAIATLIDDDSHQPPGVFTGMASCDTAAALWAFLGGETAGLNTAALRRAFSALPAHLRTYLGPRLVDMLLKEDQTEVAVDIREAMGRGVFADTRPMDLVTSEVMLARGQAERAVEHLQSVTEDPGQLQAKAITKLVEAQVAADQPVAPATADVIFAMIAEHDGHPLQKDLIATYGLALAGSGQFQQAIDFSEQGHAISLAFWSLLADHGTDDELLRFAINPPETPLSGQVSETIAKRLKSLGFPQQAAAWQDERALQGAMETPPLTLEVQTAATTGSLSENDAALLMTETERSARWDRDWPLVATSESGAWGQLAQALAQKPAADGETTLAFAAAALTKSADARALIATVFKETEEGSAVP